MLRAELPLERVPLINVNFPKTEPRGVLVTHVGRHVYEERVIPRLDPGGREYFWIGGKVMDYGDVNGSDKQLADQGFTTVTALALEATAHHHVELAQWVAGNHAAASTTA